jgi:stage II sporulation protein M
VKGNGIASWDIFNSNYLSEYADVSINSMLLWQYVIRARLRDFFILCLVGFTVFCRPVLLIYLLFLGICAGTLISAAVMHFGFMGLILYMVSVLPQYLFYGIALYFTYKILYIRTAKMKNICLVLGIAMVLILLGTYTEAYLNPSMLKGLYVYLY